MLEMLRSGRYLQKSPKVAFSNENVREQLGFGLFFNEIIS